MPDLLDLDVQPQDGGLSKSDAFAVAQGDWNP